MRKYFVLLLVIPFLFFVSSCAKKGCTNNKAINYTASAKKDDETCRYQGSAMFWIGQASAQQMLNDGINTLFVYLDGNVIGQISLSGQTFTASPACGATGAVTTLQDLFGAQFKAFSYRVVDDKSVKRWSSVVTVYGDSCTAEELVYFP